MGMMNGLKDAFGEFDQGFVARLGTSVEGMGRMATVEASSDIGGMEDLIT